MLLFTSLSPSTISLSKKCWRARRKKVRQISMLLLSSIKEKVSKENGKKFKEKINGLTKENIMANY